MWRLARDAAGLDERVTPYSIRHGMARELRKRRVPTEQIKVFLGRLPSGSDATTSIYAPCEPDFPGGTPSGPSRRSCSKCDSTCGASASMNLNLSPPILSRGCRSLTPVASTRQRARLSATHPERRAACGSRPAERSRERDGQQDPPAAQGETDFLPQHRGPDLCAHYVPKPGHCANVSDERRTRLHVIPTVLLAA